LRIDTPGLDLRKKKFELAVPDQRVTSNEGDVQGFVLVDQSEYSRDQFIPLEVRELTELDGTAQVSRIEGIASGTPQGTFFGEFDRQQGGTAGENG
jgi:hypothetical protein